MRFIMTFVWSFLLITVLNYLTTSIKDTGEFILEDGFIPAIGIALLVFLLASIIPKESTPDY